MIPLAGHTLGHCGIAVRSGDKWLLHAGDSYFHHARSTPLRARRWCSAISSASVDMDREARVANQARLRELKLGHGDRVTIFNSHDPVDYEIAGAARTCEVQPSMKLIGRRKSCLPISTPLWRRMA